MAKTQKSEKAKDRKTLRYFTAATVVAVDDSLNDITVEELINNIYLKSDDDDINYFIKQYEKQLILSKINHVRFEEGLHDFYVTTADYIKSKGMYRLFFELSYLHYLEFCKKNIKKGILSGYQNLLVQQYPYLTGSSKRVACGVDKKGKLIFIPEIGKYLTEINLELHLMIIKNGIEYVDHQGAMVKLFKKYGYRVTSM